MLRRLAWQRHSGQFWSQLFLGQKGGKTDYGTKEGKHAPPKRRIFASHNTLLCTCTSCLKICTYITTTVTTQYYYTILFLLCKAGTTYWDIMFYIVT